MNKVELRIVKKFLDPYYEIESDDQFTDYLSKINTAEPLHYLVSEINWDGDLARKGSVTTDNHSALLLPLLMLWCSS